MPFNTLHQHRAVPSAIQDLSEPLRSQVEETLLALRHNQLTQDAAVELLLAAPSDVMQEAVRRSSGMNESLLVTLARQIRRIDAVVQNLITDTGELKPGIEDQGIKLKDALDLSLRMSQHMMRDLPKLYDMDRLQKLEESLGSVMEELLTEEQQRKVLERLRELGQ